MRAVTIWECGLTNGKGLLAKVPPEGEASTSEYSNRETNLRKKYYLVGLYTFGRFSTTTIYATDWFEG